MLVGKTDAISISDQPSVALMVLFSCYMLTLVTYNFSKNQQPTQILSLVC